MNLLSVFTKNRGLARLAAFSVGACLLTWAASWIAVSFSQGSSAFTLSEIWNRWDAGYYVDLAQHGYREGDRAHSIAFFPLYPLLIHAVALGVGSVPTAALIVSNLSFVIACVGLYRLGGFDHSKQVSFRAVLLFASFPTAYFLHAMYSESLFLALAIGSFCFAREKRWVLAAALCALAGASRITGLALLPAIAWEFFWRRRDERRPTVLPTIAFATACSAGFFVYLAINYAVFGDAFRFLQFQSSHWHREFAWPSQAILNAFNSIRFETTVDSIIVSGGELLFGLGTLALVIIAWTGLGSVRPVRTSYAIFVTLGWLMSACTSFWMSQPRMTLGFFPLFFVMAQLASRRAVFAIVLSIFIFLQFMFMTRFVMGVWAF